AAANTQSGAYLNEMSVKAALAVLTSHREDASDAPETPRTGAVAPFEMVALADLTPHPLNYKEHPDDQLEQIMQSIREHGFYRNVVVARDYTILVGHGAVEAAERLGMKEVPAVKMNCDPLSAQAMRVMVGENEVHRMSELDD